MDLCQRFKTLSEFKSYCYLNNVDMLPQLAYGSSFRGNTFTKALEYLDKVKPSVIVETGTARGRFDINLPSICGDGGGSLIFALWCSRNNAKLYTVDIDPQSINNCKLNIAALGLSEYVEFVVSDSVEYLQNGEFKDLRFLFGFDLIRFHVIDELIDAFVQLFFDLCHRVSDLIAYFIFNLIEFADKDLLKPFPHFRSPLLCHTYR